MYVRPGTKKNLFLELSKTWDCGNFNARHPSWEPAYSTNSTNSGSARTRGRHPWDSISRREWVIQPTGTATFRNISTIDLFMGDRKQSVSFRKRCGLEHPIVIFRHWVDESTNKIRRGPAWGMMDQEERDNALEQLSKAEVHDMWGVLRREIDMLPKVGQSHQKSRFWSPNLE